MSLIEVLHSGVRDGEFTLFCMSEIEDGHYIVFSLVPNNLSRPFTEPNKEAAIQRVKKLFNGEEEWYVPG